MPESTGTSKPSFWNSLKRIFTGEPAPAPAPGELEPEPARARR
jgi:hypothetical protein